MLTYYYYSKKYEARAKTYYTKIYDVVYQSWLY